VDNTFKSAKVIYQRFSSLIKPQTSEWRAEAPEWINTALSQIGNSGNLKLVVSDIRVRNHRFKLPNNIKAVRMIVYNNARLPLYNNHLKDYYLFETSQPNYIQTSFERGDIKLVYYTLNLDVDGDPFIPNNNTGVIDDYLFNYVLRNWLISNKHSVFNYQDVDQKIEGPIGRRDLGLKFAAENALKWLSADEMLVLRDRTIGLYKDYDRFDGQAPADDLAIDPTYNYNL